MCGLRVKETALAAFEKWTGKSSTCAAKAAVDLPAFAARLKPSPFKTPYSWEFFRGVEAFVFRCRCDLKPSPFKANILGAF